jgi:hypothetical protein
LRPRSRPVRFERRPKPPSDPFPDPTVGREAVDLICGPELGREAVIQTRPDLVRSAEAVVPIRFQIRPAAVKPPT